MTRLREFGDWRLVHGAAVLLVLGLFLFSVRPVLSPVVLFLLLVFLLSPYAGTRAYSLVLGAAGALTLLWLLQTLGSLLAPFILALILAYIMDPAVGALQRRGLSRPFAILVLTFPVLLLVLVGVLYGIPALLDQLEDLVQKTPALVARVARWVELARTRLLRLDLPFLSDETMGRIQALQPEQVITFLQERQAAIARRAWSAVIGVGRGVSTVLGILGYVVLTPVLTFYLLRDYAQIGARVRSLVPVRRHHTWLPFLSEYDRLVSRYLRGQVLEAAAVGLLTWLGLLLLGFPYSGLVGAVAGVFNLVPYLGLVVSAVPALVIALVTGNVLASLLKALVVFVVVQFLDGAVVGPRIVGGSVGLHPVWVILALAVGGFFFGFVGLLLAVPGAVMIKLLLLRLLERYRRSEAFLGAQPEPVLEGPAPAEIPE